MKEIEKFNIKIWIEDGILYGVYPPGIDIDVPQAREIVAARIKLQEGKSYPCLFDMRGVGSATQDARRYLAEEGAQLIIASAIITGNSFTRALAHVFLTINKPKVPILLFGEIAPAKEWLMQFVGRKDAESADRIFS